MSLPTDPFGTAPTPHPRARAMKVMALTLMAPIVLFAIVLLSIVGSYPTKVLPTVIGLLWALAAAAGVFLIGFRASPFPPGSRPDPTQVLATFNAGMMLRFALSESPAIGGLVLCFAFQSGIVTYLVPAAIALVLFAVAVIPTRSVVGRVEKSFDRDGAQSNLSALFGYPPSSY